MGRALHLTSPEEATGQPGCPRSKRRPLRSRVRSHICAPCYEGEVNFPGGSCQVPRDMGGGGAAASRQGKRTHEFCSTAPLG